MAIVRLQGCSVWNVEPTLHENNGRMLYSYFPFGCAKRNMRTGSSYCLVSSFCLERACTFALVMTAFEGHGQFYIGIACEQYICNRIFSFLLFSGVKITQI